MNDFELIIEENKLVAKEILEYTKLIFVVVSIYFAFAASALTIGFKGNNEIWIALQVITPFFLLMVTTLEKENKLNSIYMIYNEKRINILAKKNLLYWQNFIGSGYLYEKAKFSRTKYLVNPILAIVFMLLLYIIPVIKISQLLTDYWCIFNIKIEQRITFIAASLLGYVLIGVIIIWSRKIAIDKIKAMIDDIKAENFFKLSAANNV